MLRRIVGVPLVSDLCFPFLLFLPLSIITNVFLSINSGKRAQRVSDLALKICTLMRLHEELSEKVHIAAHLHDIGKIGIPDAILNKEGKLNEREWEVIKRHPQIGADILSKSSHLAKMKDIILYHHERFDGLGYPAGLFGQNIPEPFPE